MPHSLTSISPGEETDNTVTVETTPSSANITPSQSSEWPHSPTSLSASAKLMMTTSGVSFTTIQVNRAFFYIINFFVALSFSVKMKDDKSAKIKPQCISRLRLKGTNTIILVGHVKILD